ncbi:hypothetical protein PFISCL1PPCAC_27441, partial [Pristionchus fissidentatus]
SHNHGHVSISIRQIALSSSRTLYISKFVIEFLVSHDVLKSGETAKEHLSKGHTKLLVVLAVNHRIQHAVRVPEPEEYHVNWLFWFDTHHSDVECSHEEGQPTNNVDSHHYSQRFLCL